MVMLTNNLNHLNFMTASKGDKSAKQGKADLKKVLELGVRFITKTDRKRLNSNRCGPADPGYSTWQGDVRNVANAASRELRAAVTQKGKKKTNTVQSFARDIPKYLNAHPDADQATLS